MSDYRTTCENCGKARYRTHTTDVFEEAGIRVRYIHCPECGHKPPVSKIIIPLSAAPPIRKLIQALLPNSRKQPSLRHA